MAPPPVVTGISPKEGPPGTRITIRGEFLGTRAQDLIGLTICGCDCLLSAEWKSPNKIIARSGPCKGRGDIIVTTHSGGQGTSTVQFKGYHETIGPMKESAVWVEEAPIQNYVWGRRALSPTNYQQDDPLGLSVEGNEKKFPEDELIELFGSDASTELTNEKFNPGMFLLQHHHATSLDDLKAGLSYLRRKVNSQKEGQLSFLKANVGSVMEQLETLMMLKEQFEIDSKTYGDNPMEKLEIAIQQSMTEANKLFDDVLARRDRADATRNALSVMQRYKFLFCMPVNIEKNIKIGNYDLVINDYARVKNLFKNTEVEVFKKVLKEIDYRIESLRELLKKRLEEPPFTLEEQKKIIRHLINLEAGGDPAWDAIVAHGNHLEKSVAACTNDYLDSDNKEDYKGSLPVKSNPSTPMSFKQFKLTKNDENNPPAKIECFEALCDIVMEQIPDLWRLGQSYFTGQLHVTADVEKQGPFKELVLLSIQYAVDAMKSACDTDLEAPWLLQNLKSIRHMYASLIHIDLPSDALDIFEGFIFDLRIQCMESLFKQTANNITILNRKETWDIEYLEGDEGVTKLPSLFEQMVLEVAKLTRETAVTCGPRESTLLADPNQQYLYHEAVKSLFVAFSRCLQNSAFSGGEDSVEDEDLASLPQHTHSPIVGYRMKENKMHGPTWEQCLLISLSNIRYTLKVVLPRIEKKLKSEGYPDMITAVGYKADWTQLETLETVVLDAYLERRCDPIVGTIEPNMYVGGINWKSNIQPTHIRPYAYEILSNLIAIHGEVRRISQRLIHRVLSHIVEIIAEELARLFLCVNRKFNASGIIQAKLDITVLRKAVDIYCTTRARNFFDEALRAIPQPVTKEDSERIEILLTKVTTRMKMQLSCLAIITDNEAEAKKVESEQVTIV